MMEPMELSIGKDRKNLKNTGIDTEEAVCK